MDYGINVSLTNSDTKDDRTKGSVTKQLRKVVSFPTRAPYLPVTCHLSGSGVKIRFGFSRGVPPLPETQCGFRFGTFSNSGSDLEPRLYER